MSETVPRDSNQLKVTVIGSAPASSKTARMIASATRLPSGRSGGAGLGVGFTEAVRQHFRSSQRIEVAGEHVLEADEHGDETGDHQDFHHRAQPGTDFGLGDGEHESGRVVGGGGLDASAPTELPSAQVVRA